LPEKVLCVKRQEECFCVDSPLLSTIEPTEWSRLINKEPPSIIHSIYDSITYPTDEPFSIHDRGIALEENAEVQQFVVGVVITPAGDRNRMLLMKCLKGDMKGYLTLVEGHVNECPYEKISMSRWLFHEMLREYNEELTFETKRPIEYTIYPKFATSNNYNKEIRSYYHLGVIFHCVVDPEYFNLETIKTGEPGINEPVILSIDEILSPDSGIHVDDWVYAIAEYFKWENGRS
jgi:hypothetical protein